MAKNDEDAKKQEAARNESEAASIILL